MASAEARFIHVEQRAGLYRTTVAPSADSLAGSHDMATLCFDFADVVIQGRDIYESITQLDEDWRMLVLKKEIDYCPGFERRIENLYREWLETTVRAMQVYVHFEAEYRSRGFDAAGVETLSRYCRETRGILTDDKEFFGHAKLFDLAQAALDEHHKGGTLEMTG